MEPVPLHDPLVPELDSGELALSNQALQRLGMYVQNSGSLDDVNVVLKHAPCLVQCGSTTLLYQEGWFQREGEGEHCP